MDSGTSRWLSGRGGSVTRRCGSSSLLATRRSTSSCSSSCSRQASTARSSTGRTRWKTLLTRRATSRRDRRPETSCSSSITGRRLPPRAHSIARMLRIGSIVLRVDDLERQAAFWHAALGYVEGRRDHDFVLLRPKDGVGPNLSLDNVPSKAQVPPRLHLDLYAQDQAAEVERLKALGATEVRWDK